MSHIIFCILYMHENIYGFKKILSFISVILSSVVFNLQYNPFIELLPSVIFSVLEFCLHHLFHFCTNSPPKLLI